jgi:acyl-CoA synthetase (AMP-forming)/AMP-acid ligase II
MTQALKLSAAFEHHAQCRPDVLLVDSELGTLRYGDAVDRVNAIINALEGLGLGPSSRFGVVARNRTETLLLLLAAQRGGAVIVPVNHRLSPSEMAWILEDSGCEALVAESMFASALEPLLPDCVKPEGRIVMGGALPGWRDFDGWVDAAAPLPAHTLRDDSPERPYLQMYTSGTTGRPKGVVLNGRNGLASSIAALIGFDVAVHPGERAYQGFPLFHIGGVFASLWLISRGATLLLRCDFDPRAVNAMMCAGEVAHATLVPAMIQACVGVDGASGDAEGFRNIFYGASPINAPLLHAAHARYGCDFSQVYGMTETHSTIAMLTAADHQRALQGDNTALVAAAGRPVSGTTLRVVDPEGNDVTPGTVGEVCVRGPQVMGGYWQRDDANAETFHGNFLRTGDAGYVDAEGYLYLVDRLKDIIVSGGENVASKEVEAVLMAHPGVADVAVIGVPDERWGEAVKAVVVMRADAVGDDELIMHCRTHLGGFKVPKSIDRIDALPRNGAGKVLKTVLREPYWQGVTRRVS